MLSKSCKLSISSRGGRRCNSSRRSFSVSEMGADCLEEREEASTEPRLGEVVERGE